MEPYLISLVVVILLIVVYVVSLLTLSHRQLDGFYTGGKDFLVTSELKIANLGLKRIGRFSNIYEGYLLMASANGPIVNEPVKLEIKPKSWNVFSTVKQYHISFINMESLVLPRSLDMTYNSNNCQLKLFNKEKLWLCLYKDNEATELFTAAKK